MTPKEKLVAIKNELRQQGRTDRDFNRCILNLEEHEGFLNLNFSLHQFIEFADKRNASEIIEALVQYTEPLLFSGYSLESIREVSLLAKGADRLETLCKYTEYLKSKGFNETQLLSFVKGNSGVQALHALVDAWDQLSELGFKSHDMNELGTHTSAGRFITKIKYNFENLKGKGLAAENIIKYVTVKTKRPRNLQLSDELPVDYSTIARNGAEAVINQFLIEKLNATSTITRVNAFNDNESIQTLTANLIQSTIPLTSFTTVTTPSMYFIEEETTTATSNAEAHFHLPTALNQEHAEQSKTVSPEKILALKLALYDEFKKLGLTIELIEPMIVDLTEYFDDFIKLSLTPATIASIVTSKDPVGLAQAFIHHMPISLAFGYSLEDISAIMTLTEGDETVKILNTYHRTFTESFGLDKDQVVKIAKNSWGYLNLSALINHYDTLINKYSLSKEEIVEILKYCHGNQNVDALVKHYDVFILLKFSSDQIIEIGKQRAAKSYFTTIMACQDVILRHGVTHAQLIDLIFSQDGIKNTCWLYFYLEKQARQIRDPARLIENLKNKKFGNLPNDGILPENYTTRINKLADEKFREQNKFLPTQAPSLIPRQAERFDINQELRSFVASTKSKIHPKKQGNQKAKIRRAEQAMSVSHETQTSSHNIAPQEINPDASLQFLEEALANQSNPFAFYSASSTTQPNEHGQREETEIAKRSKGPGQ